MFSWSLNPEVSSWGLPSDAEFFRSPVGCFVGSLWCYDSFPVTLGVTAPPVGHLWSV